MIIMANNNDWQGLANSSTLRIAALKDLKAWDAPWCKLLHGLVKLYSQPEVGKIISLQAPDCKDRK
jgi:hypothetical protein